MQIFSAAKPISTQVLRTKWLSRVSNESHIISKRAIDTGFQVAKLKFYDVLKIQVGKSI